MTAIRDLTGQTFGRLSVLRLATEEERHTHGDGAYWLCRCECGREKIVRSSSLTSNGTMSCGCAITGRTPMELAGQTFERVTAIRRAGRDENGAVLWLCVCECGAYTRARASNLASGSTKSCGCMPSGKGRVRNPIRNSRKATNRLDLTGRTFGRLTVIGGSSRRASTGAAVWICECSCGGWAEVLTHNLTSGNTTSCGCVQRERTVEVNRKEGAS